MLKKISTHCLNNPDSLAKNKSHHCYVKEFWSANSELPIPRRSPPKSKENQAEKALGEKMLQEGATNEVLFASPVAPITPFKHTGFLEDAVNKVTVLASQGFRLA